MTTPMILYIAKLLAAFAGLALIYLVLIRRRTSYRTVRLYLLAVPLVALACAFVTLKVLPAHTSVSEAVEVVPPAVRPETWGMMVGKPIGVTRKAVRQSVAEPAPAGARDVAVGA